VALAPIADEIWLADGPVVNFYSFPYPTRMAVVWLEAGGLWIWSPTALDPALKAAVDALGPVTHLVSPNKLHHLSLDAWTRAYPDAALWGPPSTIRKRRDLSFDGTLGDEPPAAWDGEIDQSWVRGSFLFDEVVFFHRASRTAIIGDLSEAFSEDFLRRHWAGWQRWIARLWSITADKGKAPLELRLSYVGRGRAQARAAVQRILDWKPERVVMAHGEWQRANGGAYLEKAFGWLMD
jgi:hypothetical protein